jgi:hypothetical protein
MAILCGLALNCMLKTRTGTVILLFNLLEEDGGAEKVLNDPKFKYNPDLPLPYTIFRTEKKSSRS